MKRHRWSLITIRGVRCEVNEDGRITADVDHRERAIEYVQCWDCDSMLAEAWGTECLSEKVPDEILTSIFWRGL